MTGPLALRGTVTSAGKMAHTCKVTVGRKYMHPIVGKVRASMLHRPVAPCMPDSEHLVCSGDSAL